MADLGFWRTVRPIAFGLAAGVATFALTGSAATATPEAASAARQVRVLPPVGQQAPCACESQVGAYLAGKPAAIETGAGGRTAVTLTAWGQGAGTVGGTVSAHQVPTGWQVTPSSRSYSVDSGDSARLSFDVIAPASVEPGTYDLVFRTVPISGTESRELRVALTVR